MKRNILVAIVTLSLLSFILRITPNDWVLMASKSGAIYSDARIQDIRSDAFDEGFSEGYEEGYNAGVEDSYLEPQIDYDPIFYYVPNGHSYHSSPNCITLRRSKDIRSAPLSELYNRDPCDLCVPNSGDY